MTPGVAQRPNAFLSIGCAAAIVALLMMAAEHVSPRHRFAPVEFGDAFVAAVGLAWAAIQWWAARRNHVRCMAWLSGAGGASLILTSEIADATLETATYPVAHIVLSLAFWTAAAGMMFACGQRYAMRRYVMATMRTALVVAAAAFGAKALALAGIGSQRWLAQIGDAAELLSVTLFVAALFLTRIAPVKQYVFGAPDIGRRARRLFRDFGLETKRRYPTTYPILGRAGFRHVFIVAMILWFAPRAASAVALAGGKSRSRQVWDMLRLGFVEDIDAKSYYVHDLYRTDCASSADETLTRVETKNGLTRALRTIDADPTERCGLNDKLEFWRTCELAGVTSAPIIGTAENGVIELFGPRATLDRNLFVKERKGRGGRTTMNFERIAPFVYRDDSNEVVSIDPLLATLQEISASARFIIQPKLSNHPAIAGYADKALIVFRVVTCLDWRGEPHVTHGVLRLLRRFEPNWPKTPDADWGCAIDLESGKLGMMTGEAPETCTKWFAEHPVTHERVEGRMLEGWRDIAATAIAGHRVFSSQSLIGWDIGWTPEGPVILEGNSNMDFSYFQRVYRTPIGRSPLAPLLNAKLTRLADRLCQAAAV